jgi:hypothetical protein
MRAALEIPRTQAADRHPLMCCVLGQFVDTLSLRAFIRKLETRLRSTCELTETSKAATSKPINRVNHPYFLPSALKPDR